ncbi:MAG: DUF4388 domain-containing protein [Gemmatimonadales bacterium]
MAIEGPLRELGIHDVFQLLDLSRKTGTLAVTSELRDNEGTVHFQNGRVVAAAIRSNPHRLGDLLMRTGRVTAAQVAAASAAQKERGDSRRLGEILLEMGAISQKELERQVRLQIEAVIFELLSWREGFFRFEEGAMDGDPMVQIGTEALLMEGARRIDEWSRISDRVPSLLAIPRLASLKDDQHAPMLDLLPSEWEVLTMIDGSLDLRAIASQLARTEFDTAKVVYGLVSTGVVELVVPPSVAERVAARAPTPPIGTRAVADVPTPVVAPLAVPPPPVADGADDLERGFQYVLRGDFQSAVGSWATWLQAHPRHDMTGRVRDGLESAARLRALVEARYPAQGGANALPRRPGGGAPA